MQTQVDDVRQLLDADLKTNCEAFILDTAKVNSEPLIKFVKTKSVNGIDSQFTGIFY
jgi:hypothetical protein